MATIDFGDERQTGKGHWLAQGKRPDARKVGLMWSVDEPKLADVPDALAKAADGKVRLAACYQEAGRFVMAYRGARLVHGTVSVGQKKSADGAGVAIAHAWVELDAHDAVYDGVQGKFYDKQDYYAKMRAVAEQTYNGEEACEMMLEKKHFGPWGKTAGIQ